MIDIDREELTGLYSERFMKDNFVRYSIQYPFSRFIMIDLQQFKAINDGYGYVEGDHSLKTMGTLLASCFDTESDLVSRLHGDEFCILTNRSQEKIFRLFKELDRRLEEKFKNSETKTRIRFNSGDTAIRDNYDDSQSNATVMLHEAKRLGTFYVPYNLDLIESEQRKQKYLEKTDRIISSGNLTHVGRRLHTATGKTTGLVQMYTRDQSGASFLSRDIIVKNHFSLQDLDVQNVVKVSEYVRQSDDKMIVLLGNNTLARIDEIMNILDGLGDEERNRIIFSIDMHNIEDRDVRRVTSAIKMLKDNGVGILVDKGDTTLPIDVYLNENVDYVRIDPKVWKQVMQGKMPKSKLDSIRYLTRAGRTDLIIDYITSPTELNFAIRITSGNALFAGEQLSNEIQLSKRIAQ